MNRHPFDGESLTHPPPEQRNPIRTYVATLLEKSSSGATRQTTVRAFTAADAITQLELEQRGSIPGWRVYRVEPASEVAGVRLPAWSKAALGIPLEVDAHLQPAPTTTDRSVWCRCSCGQEFPYRCPATERANPRKDDEP